MSDIRYTEDHEWVRIDGDTATVGITDYAQEQLGDIVFIDMPEIGAALAQGDDAAVVESVKAASDIYAPITGEIEEVNDTLEGEPGRINEDAEGEGWFFRLSVSDTAELDNLMDEEAYQAFVKKL